MKNKNILTILFLMLVLTVISCGNSNKKSDRIDAVEKEVVKAPEFNADSAYAYVGAQADFGPRVPNTKAHEECGEYLAQQLEKFGAKVYNQRADLIAWDGTILKARNIIGAYKPESKKRIMLCAHWDSRPYADNDPDPKNHHNRKNRRWALTLSSLMRKTTEHRNFIQDNPNRIHGVWGHSSGHALPTYRIIMPATEFCLIW